MQNAQRKTKGRVDELDKAVGSRVRKLRVVKGLSQEKLAEQLGITFQQVQKYEQGTNRISVSRLIYISKALKTPVEYFFNDLDSKNTPIPGFAESSQDDFSSEGSEEFEDIFKSRETMELLKTYYSVDTKEARKDLMKIIKAFAHNAKSH